MRYCSASALTRRSGTLLVIVSLSTIGPSPIYDDSRGEASESGEVSETSHMVVRADMLRVALPVITQPAVIDRILTRLRRTTAEPRRFGTATCSASARGGRRAPKHERRRRIPPECPENAPSCPKNAVVQPAQ